MELRSPSRDAEFFVFVKTCLKFTCVLVLVTAFYSNLMAIAVIGIILQKGEGVILGDAQLFERYPDLLTSVQVYEATCAVFLLVVSLGLAVASQASLLQWVSAARVCNVKTGRPCGVGRVYLSQVAQILVDAALMALIWLSTEDTGKWKDDPFGLLKQPMHIQCIILLVPVLFLKPFLVSIFTPSLAADGRSWGDALAGSVPLLQTAKCAGA